MLPKNRSVIQSVIQYALLPSIPSHPQIAGERAGKLIVVILDRYKELLTTKKYTTKKKTAKKKTTNKYTTKQYTTKKYTTKKYTTKKKTTKKYTTKKYTTKNTLDRKSVV